MCSFLIDDNSQHKKAKGRNKNVVEKLTQSEYKDFVLNNEYDRLALGY